MAVEQLTELSKIRTFDDYQTFISNQLQKFYDKLEAWSKLQDPEEPQEESMLSNEDIDMFIALRKELGS